jgi:uncharacterized membrane protein
MVLLRMSIDERRIFLLAVSIIIIFLPSLWHHAFSSVCNKITSIDEKKEKEEKEEASRFSSISFLVVVILIVSCSSLNMRHRRRDYPEVTLTTQRMTDS